MFKVIIDLDDTSFDFTPEYLDFHNKEYGTNLTIDKFFTYDFSEVFGYSRLTVCTRVMRFYDTDEFLNLKPIPGAVEAINKLSEFCELYHFTQRSRSLKNKTYDSIDENYPGKIKDIFFAKGPFNKFARSKHKIIKKYNISIAVDDIYDIAEKIAENDIPVYLHPQPWNNNSNNNKNIHRIQWPNIVDHIFNQQIYK